MTNASPFLPNPGDRMSQDASNKLASEMDSFFKETIRKIFSQEIIDLYLYDMKPIPGMHVIVNNNREALCVKYTMDIKFKNNLVDSRKFIVQYQIKK